MKRIIVVSILSIVILIPFLINILGWNLYTYINLGDKDLVLAAAQGLSHNALSEQYARDVLITEFYLPNDYIITVIDLGFIDIFLERSSGEMTLFSFNIIRQDQYSDYSAVEFPWLLFLLIPYLVFILYPRNEKESKYKKGRSEDDKAD